MARSIARLLAICALCLPMMGQDFGSGIPMVNVQPAAAGAPLSMLFFGEANTVLVDDSTRYYSVVTGESAGLAAQTSVYGIISTPGDFKNIRLELSGDIGDEIEAATATMTLMKSTSTTAVACTITGASGDERDCEDPDAPETVHFDAGELVSLRTVVVGNANAVRTGWSLHFISDNADEQNLLGHYNANHTTGTKHGPVGGHVTAATTTVFDVGFLFAVPGAVKNLYVEVATCPGAGDTRTYTVQLDGVDTAITCNVSGNANCGDGATQQCVDTGNGPVDVAAGEYLTLKDTVTGGTTNVTQTYVGLTFVPDTSGKFVFAAFADNSPSTTANEYVPPSGNIGNIISNENNIQTTVEQAFTVTDMDAQVATAPGASASWLITLREDLADTAAPVVCTITDPATDCGTPFSGTEAIAGNSEINVESDPSATAPASTNMQVGLAGTIP